MNDIERQIEDIATRKIAELESHPRRNSVFVWLGIFCLTLICLGVASFSYYHHMIRSIESDLEVVNHTADIGLREWKLGWPLRFTFDVILHDTDDEVHDCVINLPGERAYLVESIESDIMVEWVTVEQWNNQHHPSED